MKAVERTSVTPVLTVAPLCRHDSVSQDVLPAECIDDEFCGAGGQRLKVRGTPAGSQGRSGLQ